jgi:type II secretory pathway component PulF
MSIFSTNNPMAVFVYQAAGLAGERLSGEVEASTRAEALRRLARDRIQPLKLVARGEDSSAVPARDPAARSDRTRSDGALRLTQGQVILFTDELADFLHAGLQLEPALHLMENREERSPVKAVAARLREKVRDGVSFSEALPMASASFGDLYGNLVAAGEASGALAPLLRRQSQHLIAMQDLSGRIKLALIYPAFLVAAGLVAIAVFMTVLIPQMTKLLVKTGTELPWSTYLLMNLGKYSQRYGLFVALGLALVAVLFISAIRQPRGRRWWDEAKLRLPLFGPLMSAFFYAQFCQTTANLLLNGLPLLNSLKLMSRVTGNEFFRGLILRVTELVGEGASLTRAMKSVGHFPPALRDLVKVGEQTGELGATLHKVGERFDKVIQQRIDRIMSLVPLLVIVALGAMVFLIAWSMLSGIFQAVHGMQAHH